MTFQVVHSFCVFGALAPFFNYLCFILTVNWSQAVTRTANRVCNIRT